MKTATKTTRVPERVSFRDGQVTFFNSVLTSLKNCFAASNFSFIENSIYSIPKVTWQPVNHVGFTACHAPYMVHGLPCTLHGAWQARRDLNPHHPDLESGALSVRATGLYLCIRFEVRGSLRLRQKTTLQISCSTFFASSLQPQPSN